MYCFGCWLKLCALVRPHSFIQLGGGPMKVNFETGQLVRNRHTKDLGVVRDVKPDYYGATQAFKVYDAQPGQVIRPGSENGIGPTKDGIRDRVLVRWVTDYEKDRSWAFSWHDGKNIEIVEDESGLPSL